MTSHLFCQTPNKPVWMEGHQTALLLPSKNGSRKYLHWSYFNSEILPDGSRYNSQGQDSETGEIESTK